MQNSDEKDGFKPRNATDSPSAKRIVTRNELPRFKHARRSLVTPFNGISRLYTLRYWGKRKWTMLRAGPHWSRLVRISRGRGRRSKAEFGMAAGCKLS